MARVGQQVAITQRNYKRYLGILLDTHWVVDEIELGVDDRLYDVVDGKYYYERKIIKTRMGGLIDFQIIKDRVPLEPAEAPEEVEPIPDIAEESGEEATDNKTVG